MKIRLLLLTVLLAIGVRADQNQDTKRIEAKVVRYVDSYYKTHAVEGKPAPSGYVTVDIDLTKTEAIDGWAGHYRTSGHATISLIDVGPNYAVDFEAISEIDDKNILRVTEVKTVKIDS